MSSSSLQYRGLPAEIRIIIWRILVPETINFTHRAYLKDLYDPLFKKEPPNSLLRSLHEAELRRSAGYQEGVVMYDKSWDEHKTNDLPRVCSFNLEILRLNRQTRDEVMNLFRSRTTFDFSGFFAVDDHMLFYEVPLSSLPPMAHRMIREIIIQRRPDQCYLGMKDLHKQLRFPLQLLTIILDPFGRDRLESGNGALLRPISRRRMNRGTTYAHHLSGNSDAHPIIRQMQNGHIHQVDLLFIDSSKTVSQLVDPGGKDKLSIDVLSRWDEVRGYSVPRTVDWTFSEGILGCDSFSTYDPVTEQTVLAAKQFHPTVLARFSGCEVCMISLKARNRAQG